MGIWIGGDDVWIVWNNDDNNNLSLIFCFAIYVLFLTIVQVFF